MSYTDYGLDEKKISHEEGTKGRSDCLWCNYVVHAGFSMCFQDFVLCRSCAESAALVENQVRWEDGADCFKCSKKNIIGYLTAGHSGLHICKDCIDWCRSTFNNWMKNGHSPAKFKRLYPEPFALEMNPGMKLYQEENENFKMSIYEKYFTPEGDFKP